ALAVLGRVAAPRRRPGVDEVEADPPHAVAGADDELLGAVAVQHHRLLSADAAVFDLRLDVVEAPARARLAVREGEKERAVGDPRQKLLLSGAAQDSAAEDD